MFFAKLSVNWCPGIIWIQPGRYTILGWLLFSLDYAIGYLLVTNQILGTQNDNPQPHPKQRTNYQKEPPACSALNSINPIRTIHQAGSNQITNY